MGHFDRRGGALEEPRKRRQPGSRLADLGDRIARTFPSFDKSRPLDWQADDGVEYPAEREQMSDWEQITRFPVVRSGYDCATVDEHVADLERELAELEQELGQSQKQLRAQASAKGEVVEEIQRVGEQTSAILLAAHDKAAETTRRADAEAERCVADAAANAVAITEGANRKLRQIREEIDTLSRNRAGLLQDIRDLAGTLRSLADGAEKRSEVKPDFVAPSDEPAHPERSHEEQTEVPADEEPKGTLGD